MSIKDFIEPLVQQLKESSSVKTVYGEPIEIHKKTLIPVARSGFGFASRPGENTDVISAGGGTLASPIGMLEVTENETRFIPINDHHPLQLFGAFAAGMLIGAALLSRGRILRPGLKED